VLQVSMNADAAGIVTVRSVDDTQVLGTIPIGERGFLCIHREASSSGGGTEVFYYKAFFKNTGAGTLTSGQVSETNDAAGRVSFAVAGSVNDSGSVANRKTAPGGLTFDNAVKNIPASLAPNDAIGVWFKYEFPAGDIEWKTSNSVKVMGTP